MENNNKASKIEKIENSWKYEGFCYITTIDGKLLKRKLYPRKTGSLKDRVLVNLDADIFSFAWDYSINQNLATDIQWMGNYSSIDEAVQAHEQQAIPEVQIPEVKVENGEIKHEKFGQIKVCVENDIPVYLAGPAGSGKNHTLEQIARELELDFYFTNSVQQEYKITGFIDAGGIYHETEFYKAFTNGGIFFLDEMDASIPEVLVLLNAAIANKYFEFPNGKVSAHEDFRVVAAGNTVGNGADEQYTGRLTLDQATLDRFVIIEFDYSQKIELYLAHGNTDLVDFIRDLRTQAKEKGVRATFSYRAITMVTKLEGKIELVEVLVMAVFKGLDKDTINTFKSTGYSKYYTAMKKAQA